MCSKTPATQKLYLLQGTTPTTSLSTTITEHIFLLGTTPKTWPGQNQVCMPFLTIKQGIFPRHTTATFFQYLCFMSCSLHLFMYYNLSKNVYFIKCKHKWIGNSFKVKDKEHLRADAKSTTSYFLSPTFLGPPKQTPQRAVNMFLNMFKKL